MRTHYFNKLVRVYKSMCTLIFVSSVAAASGPVGLLEWSLTKFIFQYFLYLVFYLRLGQPALIT
jgi:hypothetical protein